MSTPHVRFTAVVDGDLGIDSPGVERRRAELVDLPWSWLRQEHGGQVLTVHTPGDGCGHVGDALVTRSEGAVLAVQVADCAPIALLAPDAVGVVHAGWRGVVAGVVPAAVDRLRALTDGPILAVVGPCIGPECYEFGADDLERVVDVVGPTARGTTAFGGTALDLRAAVVAGLQRAGIDDIAVEGGCTACGGSWWSHRARGDGARQAVMAWLA